MQDYLQKVFVVKFKDNWKNDALNICKILAKYRGNELVSAKKAISSSDVDKFSFKMLDFTSLKAIAVLDDNKKEAGSELRNNGYYKIIDNSKIKSYIKNSNDDRGFESHPNYNESYDELKEHIVGSIKNMNDLLNAVAESDNYELFIDIVKKYKTSINEIRNEFNKYDSDISSIRYDINLIINGRETFTNLWLKYYPERNGKNERYILFNKIACDNRIAEGIYFHSFDYYEGFFIEKDTNKAFNILYDNYEYLNNKGKALLATIYCDKEFYGYSEEKANEIIENIGKESVREYINKNGNKAFEAI